MDAAFEIAVEEALAHGEDEADEGEDEEEEEERQTREYIQVIDSPRVSQNAASLALEDGEKERNRRSEDRGEGCSTSGSQENERNRAEIEGQSCPICMEAWTSGGEHHICCLPCGHLYGFSCIKKWLRQHRSSGKCPQCNRKCRLKDVRKIFASWIAAVDDESHKNADWCKKEAEWRKTEAELRSEVNQLRKRTTYLESLLSRDGQKTTNLSYQQPFISGHNIGPKFNGQMPSCSFRSQGELRTNGARIFDIDASRQILLLARRLPGVGGTHVLTQMSLISPYETEDILMPSATKAIKDLHVSPNDDGLALFGSLGKKLSVISLQSHNIILAYDLPAAAWSCSWHLNNSHFICAGLQNGMLLVFDMRQTTGPLKSLNGLTSNPVHTLHSVAHGSTLPSGVQSFLSASSIGLCQWNIGGSDERPFLVPETGNSGVCISSAHCSNSNEIVASYRPRVELSDDMLSTQPLPTPSSVNGCGVEGSHVHLKKMGIGSYQPMGSASAIVNNIRLPKTLIIDLENQKQLFASWDESTLEILLQELPTFAVSQRFKSAGCPIHDVKHARVLGQRLLGFLSEDRLQLLSF